MYQVLYRKYRPKTFSDVVGQEHVTNTLINEITSNRLAHAYVFTGSRGTGKTTCAKILSKAVNCRNPDMGNPCCECDICTGIDNGSVFDVVEIDAASNNGVDDIRALREEVNFTPASGKYRVYIIDEVHMLSGGAFNALLKTLEEPPEHVLFILATTEVHKLPATILSRCQRFDFRRIDDKTLKSRLLHVAGLEDIKLAEEAAYLIARLADGGMRDALSLLDQCVAASSDIDVNVVNSATGLADRKYLTDTTQAIIDSNTAEVLNIVDSLHQSGADMERLCEELISYFRNIMIAKTVADPKGYIVASDEVIEKISEFAKAMPLVKILGSLDILQETQGKLHFGLSRRVEMELALITICTDTGAQKPVQNSAVPTVSSNNEELLKRISMLEKQLQNVKSTPAPTVKTEPNKETPQKVLIDGLFNEWGEVIEKIGETNKPLEATLKDSTAYVSDTYILIEAKDDQFRELMMEHKDNKEVMRKIIHEMTGKRYNFGPFKKENAEFKENSPLAELAKNAADAGIDVKIIERNDNQ